MKKYVLFAVAAMLTFGSVSAQRPEERQRPTVTEMVERLKKELNLTSEQTEKITALYTNFDSKRKEGGEQSREKMREERKKLDEKVEAVLTEEQKATFKAMREKRGEGPRGKQKKN